MIYVYAALFTVMNWFVWALIEFRLNGRTLTMRETFAPMMYGGSNIAVIAWMLR